LTGTDSFHISLVYKPHASEQQQTSINESTVQQANRLLSPNVPTFAQPLSTLPTSCFINIFIMCRVSDPGNRDSIHNNPLPAAGNGQVAGKTSVLYNRWMPCNMISLWKNLFVWLT